jgi:hypothetical protein
MGGFGDGDQSDGKTEAGIGAERETVRGPTPPGAFEALLTHPWVPEQTIRGHTPPPF